MPVKQPRGLIHPSVTNGRTAPAEGTGGLEPAVYVACGLSLLAAGAHLWAMPEHLQEWWGYGAFFLAAALGQGLFAGLLLRWSPAPPLLLAGVAGNLALVLAYVLTRTNGIPIGPHAGEMEEAGLLDMSATVAEIGIVILLVTLLQGGYRKVAVNAVLALGAAVWVLRLAGVLV